MRKRGKILIAVGSSLLAVSLSAFLAIYFVFLHHYKGSKYVYEWHDTDVFSIDDIPVVQKQKDKDFVILNLADVQMSDLEHMKYYGNIHKEITELVETYKPDLITLTGDQTWSNENLVSLKKLKAVIK